MDWDAVVATVDLVVRYLWVWPPVPLVGTPEERGTRLAVAGFAVACLLASRSRALW